MECPHGLPLQLVKDFGCDDCVNNEYGGKVDRLEEIKWKWNEAALPL